MTFPGQIAGELPATQQTIATRPIRWADGLKATNGLKATSGLQATSGPEATGLAAPEAAFLQKAAFREKATFLQKAWYEMGRTVMAAYMHLTLDVDIRWQAPLPEGPKILAANHPTTTDPLYLLPLLSEPVSFLVTAACFDMPVVGAYLRAAGHLPAIRGSGGATVDAMVSQVEAGRSVAIFPEGALSPLGGGFHQPHSGVARVALRTGAPVIPIGVGLQRDRIRVTDVQVDGDKAVGHLYLSGPYAITVGRPLTFAGEIDDHERVRAVAAQIMHQIRDLARESESRIRQAQAPVAVPQPSARPVEAL